MFTTGAVRASTALVRGRLDRRASGMTLIEMMIVVSILAIASTIALPSMQQMLRESRVRTQSGELSASLNLTRSEAIKRAETVTLCKVANPDATTPACSNTSNWSAGWMVFVDRNTPGTFDGSGASADQLLRVVQIKSGSALTGSTGYTNSISYLRDGTAMGNAAAANQSGSLTLCRDGVQRVITIGSSGNIRVTKGTC